MSRTILIGCLSLGIACGDRDLRGTYVRSSDGETYLVVDERDGPMCTTLYLDRQPWPYALHIAGRVTPGTHQLGCDSTGATLAFEARVATTYHFNYWGP
jgi:hypothetical protein